MTKTLLSTAVLGVLGSASFNANAALADGDTLSITQGDIAVVSCVLGTAPPCDNTLFNQTGIVGSFFNLGSDVLLGGNEGIVLGSTQLATGSHSGAPDGSESPSIDNPWLFNGNTGMHQSTSNVTANSDTALDFAGWSVTWNGIADIPMGGDTANFVDDTGIAIISCGACGDGDAYTLDYAAHVPLNDASGFGGAPYALHLEGFITKAAVIPVPAAVWLFGSGLLGLVGVARRKKRV